MLAAVSLWPFLKPIGLGSLGQCCCPALSSLLCFFWRHPLVFPVSYLFVIRLYFGQFLPMLLSSLRICCLLASNWQERNSFCSWHLRVNHKSPSVFSYLQLSALTAGFPIFCLCVLSCSRFVFRRQHFNLIPPPAPQPFCNPSQCFSPICCGWLWQAARGSAPWSSLSDGTESRRVVGLIRDRGTGKIVRQDAGLQRTPPAWQCNHCLKSVGDLGRRLIKHLVLPLARSPSLWLSYSLSLHNPRDRWFLKQMSPPGWRSTGNKSLLIRVQLDRGTLCIVRHLHCM